MSGTRLLRHGNFLRRLGLTRSQVFWLKVDGDGALDECWIWTGAKGSNGYGFHSIGSERIGAHRFAYEDVVGPIPDGLELDHLCRERLCVNPWHLDPVTRQENQRRTPAALKTHCIHGHALSGPNLYIHAIHGRRGCRTCRIAQAAKSNAKIRARQLAVAA